MAPAVAVPKGPRLEVSTVPAHDWESLQSVIQNPRLHRVPGLARDCRGNNALRSKITVNEIILGFPSSI